MPKAPRSLPLLRIFLGSRPGTRSRAVDPDAAGDESAELRRLERVLNRHFRSYTILPAQGYWKGKTERARVVTVTAEAGNLLGKGRNPVDRALRDLKRSFRQEMILVERGACEPL